MDEFEPQAIHDHESADGWRVFFRTAWQRDGAAAAVLSSLGSRLSQIETAEVPDDGWAKRSQANLKAIRVGRIVVAPPWDVGGQGPGAGDIVIIIAPSTGFGTGHHETTRLCLTLMQDADLAGRRAIDVGTGSGVLAIAAWRLGASSVLAFDDDPEALQNAGDNVSRNGAEGAIELRKADLDSIALEPADVVMANITGAVLRKHAERLGSLVKTRGRLLVSGFGPDEERAVAEAFGNRIVQHARAGEWAAALLVSRPRNS